MLERLFRIRENGSTARMEALAGVTTFFATAYIILVNPRALSQGDPAVFNGVFFATCIGAAVGTFLMAFYAKLPFVQAPGMGLSAFFAYTAMPAVAVLLTGGGASTPALYGMTLPLVLYSGVIFIVVSAVGLREKIINGIPDNIKKALTGGIGLFIAYIGLQNAGIIAASPATQVTLIDFADRAGNSRTIVGALLALAGLFVITALSSRRVKGAVLIGIVATTLLAFLAGHSAVPENFSFDIGRQAADFVEVSLFRLDFAGPFVHGRFGETAGTVLALVLAFFMVNMFDSMATIYGVCLSAGMLDKNGEVRGLKKGLMADAVGTAAGALLGTSTVTTVVESATGIGEGGRTGLTSFVAGLLFLAALVFAPLIVLIPDVATAPALIYVGSLMMGNVGRVDFSEPTEAVPAFLTIIMMPLTYSIANGIAFGLVSYVVAKLLTGRTREIQAPTAVVACLFVLQFVLR